MRKEKVTKVNNDIECTKKVRARRIMIRNEKMTVKNENNILKKRKFIRSERSIKTFLKNKEKR